MVYLVRTAEVINNWEKAWEFANKMTEYFKENYKEVKISKFLTRISGAVNEYTWILGFDSLADEEKAALKMVKDEKYFDLMRDVEGSFINLNDDLYREF